MFIYSLNTAPHFQYIRKCYKCLYHLIFYSGETNIYVVFKVNAFVKIISKCLLTVAFLKRVNIFSF